MSASDNAVPPDPAPGGDSRDAQHAAALPSVLAATVRALSPADLAVFAEMLAGLVRARMPLPEAIRLIGEEAEKRRLRESLEQVQREVAAGAPLAEALRRCRGRFPELFVCLLEQGLAANDLHAALVEMVREFRAQARFREQLWSQLLGPIVTAGFLAVLMLGLIVWNIPKAFNEVWDIWRIMGRNPPPWPLRGVYAAGEMLHDPAVLACLGGALLLALLLFWRLWANRTARFWMQRGLLHLPIAGPFLRSVMLGRFCRLLAILLLRRVPLNAALRLVRDSIAFLPAREAVSRVTEQVDNGGSFPDALAANRFFPATLAGFARGAELHGELPQSMSRLADTYEQSADVHGVRLRLALYVTTVLFIGVWVALIMLSIFMPLYGLQEMMRKK